MAFIILLDDFWARLPDKPGRLTVCGDGARLFLDLGDAAWRR